jgi:hypothetical protein
MPQMTDLHLFAGAGSLPERAAHIYLAGQNGVDRFKKVLRGLLLHHKAIGTGPEHGKGEDILLMHRQHQDPRMRQTFAELPDKLQAILIAEGEIDERKVGFQADGSFGTLINAGGVSADNQILMLVDQLSQGPAYQEAIIHDQDLRPGNRSRGSHSCYYCTFVV